MLLSPKQIEFCKKGNKRWNFKGGATRSGKTYLDFRWIIPIRIRERIGQDGLAVILGVTKSTIERNVLDFKNEDHMMETLYHDDVTTIDNIAEYARFMSSFRPVLTSVANLYLRRQIIFGRM